MQAPSPLFKISCRASIPLIAGLLFCAPAFSAQEYSSATHIESISNDSPQIEQIDTPQLIEEQKIVSDEKQKSIGDHFTSLNPFKKKNEEEQGSSALFGNDDTISDFDLSNLIDKTHKVEDLAYGEILLDYYTNHNYDALIRARVAQDKSELKNNKEHVNLILAQLYILEGLPRQAEDTLRKIPANKISAQTRNRTFFQLARINIYQGDLDSARRILENDFSSLSGALELERKTLLSGIYVNQNNKEAVTHILTGSKPEETRNGYIKYNLASAAMFAGNEEFALPLLLELSTSPHVDLEARSLKDQVNVNLGQHYLKQDKLDEAKTYFSLVSYEGPHSSEALYYLAWIQLKQNDAKTAFALWVDLSKRNPADPFVGKSYLIRPYTLEKLNSSHLALSGYLRASELYEKLIEDVDATIKIIESETWIEKLRPASLDSTSIYEKVAKQPGWIKTQTNEANFLIDLYSSDEFAIIYQNFWELELSRQEVGKQGKKFHVFQLQQDTHNQKFDLLIPEAKVVLASDRIQRILNRLLVIDQEIKSITVDNNFLAAPTEAQAKHLEKITYLKSILDNEPLEQYKAQRRYLAMLEGVNAWDMSQDMNDRQWKIREQYRELNTLLAETQKHRKLIESGINNANYYQDIMPKLNQVSAQLDLKLLQLELLSLKYQKLMQAQALDILNARKKEYKSLRVRAKLAAARLQDNVVTGGKK